MAELVGKSAPNFTATAVLKQEFTTLSLKDYCGKYLAIFFYPMDFTRVCASEILAVSEDMDKFKQRNCEFIGVSCDSEFSHLAWIKKLTAEKDIVDINMPLLSDKSGRIAKDFGVYNEEQGVANRALFLIDDKQVIRNISINDRPVGRSVEQVLRLLDELLTENKVGEVNGSSNRGVKRSVTEEADEAPKSKSLKPLEEEVQV